MNQPPAVVWHTEDAREFTCDVVNAEASKTGVVVSYGAIRGDRFVGVNLQGRTELPAETAKNLRDLLVRLIRDADAVAGNMPDNGASSPFQPKASEAGQ